MRRLSAVFAALFALCGSAAAEFTAARDTDFPRHLSGRVYYSEWDACSGATTPSGAEGWIGSYSSGAGATLSAAAPTDLSDPCAAAIDLGTVATNDSGIRTHVAAFDLGNGELCMIAWIREVVVSDDVTSDFIARVGISNGDTAPTGFVGFRYNDNVNSGEWEAVARSGSVETATVFDTGLVYTAGTSRWFKSCINAGATSASLYTSTTGPYNMTLVVTHASNIPTATEGAGVVLQRTVGTAASIPMRINFLAVEWKPTTARW